MNIQSIRSWLFGVALLGLVFAANPRAEGVTYTWTPAGAGTYNWNNAGAQDNWGTGSGGAFPNAVGDVADMGSVDITGTVNVLLPQPITIGTWNIGDFSGAQAYTVGVTSGNAITFDNGGSGAVINRVSGGNPSVLTINAPIILADNLTYNSPGGGTRRADYFGVISETGGSRSITKTGPGTLNMRNGFANTYTGNTNITGGFWDQYTVNGVPSGLGMGDLNVTAGSFLYRASNTLLNGMNVSVGAFVSTGAGGNLNLRFGFNDANSVISGSVNNGTGNVSLLKVGSGNATINSSATNTVRNLFMLSGAGTMTLDFANMPTPTNLFANSTGGGLFLSGGTFAIKAKGSGTTNQTFALLTNNQSTGAAYVTLDQNGGSGVNLTITSPTLTRAAGTTIDFSKTGTGNFNWNPTLTNSIIGGWATANKNTWATVTTGQVVELTTYTTTSFAGNASGNYSSALNIDVDSNQTINAGVTINSLRFNDSTANRTLTLTGPSTINSGGILVGSGVSAHNELITGSTLNGAAGVDLAIHQHNAGGSLEIASQIIDNGAATALTKSGEGLLKLSNGSNSYTGLTYISQGTLQLGASQAIPSASGAFMSAKATLDLNGFSETMNTLDGLDSSRIKNNGGGAVNLTFSSTFTSWGGIIQDGTGTINVTKTGAGAIAFSNANTYSGNTTINGGTLSLTMNGAVGGSMNNSLLITVNSGATLNSFTQPGFTIGPASSATQRVLTIDSGATANTWNLIVGAGSGNGLINQNGTMNGVVSPWGRLTVGAGAGSVGVFNQGGSSFTRFGSILVGDAATANGTVNVTGGTFNASETPSSSTSVFIVGNSGTGTLNQTGGTVRSAGATNLFLGMNAGASGTYLQDHGAYIAANSLVIGESGTGLFSQNIDGTASIAADTIVGDLATGNGTHNIVGTSAVSTLNYIVGNAASSHGVVNMTGGTINLNAGGSPHLFVGNEGTGVFNHSGGTVNATTPNGYVSIGEAATGDGTYNLSGTGNLMAGLYLLVGDGGHGVVNQTGGSASAGDIAIGESGLVGQYEMHDGALSASGGLFVGDFGIGTFNLYSGGTQSVNTGLVSIGQVSGSIGVVTMDGGTVNTTQLYVGNNGAGVIEQTAGTMNVTAGDAFVTISEGATGGGTYNLSGTGNLAAGLMLIGDLGHGIMNQTGGAVDVAVLAIAESGLGGEFNMSGGSLNISGGYYIGDNGPGTWNVSGASTTTNLTAATANTNSVRAAILAVDPSIAADGNIILGVTATNSGAVDQSDGTINVSANIAVGYAGSGNWNQTGGVTNVGLNGGTGGDVVLGVSLGSSGAYTLAGGTLNVTTGSGSIARGMGSGSFTFSGGTLKVVDFNDTATFSGDLGGLVQDGPTTLLDVTSNNTTIHGTYNLKDGTVNTGSTRTTTVTGALAADGTGAKTVLVTGAGTLNANGLAVLGGGELTKTDIGVLRISGAQSNGANSTLNASGGTTILNSDAGSVGNLNLNVITSGATTVATLNSTEHVASINASGGSKVELTTNGGLYTPGNKYAHTGSLAIDATSTVDIGNGALIVNYTGNTSPYAAVLADVMGSFNGGYWDLPGLTSSAAAADVFVGGITTLGVVDNADLAYDSISGSQFSYDAVGNVPANSVLVKFTYYGDSDLNGEVTADDLTNFFYGFDGLGPASWVYGDFDYSGEVTADDLTIWALGFDNQAGTLSAGGGPVAVPEPSSILLLVLGGLGLAWRARRGKKN